VSSFVGVLTLGSIPLPSGGGCARALLGLRKLYPVFSVPPPPPSFVGGLDWTRILFRDIFGHFKLLLPVSRGSLSWNIMDESYYA